MVDTAWGAETMAKDAEGGSGDASRGRQRQK